MEIKITTAQVLQILHVLSWIIFIGLCVETGSFIFNAIFSLSVNQNGAHYFGLSELYHYDHGYFVVELLFMTIVGVLKTLMFYLIVKLLHDKKLNMSHPFNHEIKKFMTLTSYLVFGIGLFSLWGARNTEWLVTQGVRMPDIQYLSLGGGDVWLFMGVVLTVIAQIFKRGIEIQSENELTI